MNARQKAKHYKRLYEQSKVSYNTVYITQDTLRKCSVCAEFSGGEIDTIEKRDKEEMREWMAKKLTYRISRELEKVLLNFIEFDKDGYKASFEFWVKR